MKRIASATERTTAATDVVLCLAAAGGIVLLQSLETAASWRIQLWSWTFALIALAAALGAVYHGLVLSESSRSFLWRVLTVCLGMAISLFVVGVFHDAYGVEAARRILPILLAAGMLSYAVSRLFEGLFIVFIVYQALALAVALCAYAGMAAWGTLNGAGWMTAGAAVSALAAGIQAVRNMHVTLVWEFDRNGMFHLVQTLGLILFCVGLCCG
jgi:hypothetical protein